MRYAVRMTLGVFLLPAIIGLAVDGWHGAAIGSGVGAIAAVGLSIAAYRAGKVGGDVLLAPGQFLECTCGECHGASIKKLLPDTAAKVHNRVGKGLQCLNPNCRFIFCSLFQPGENRATISCPNCGKQGFEDVKLLYRH